MSLKISMRFPLIGLLGFFSGLPLALTASTLTAWLADSKIDRAQIGLFAAIATPYALKFLWSPLLDGAKLPWLTKRLGRRRSWLLVTQALLALAMAQMAIVNPATDVWLTALIGVVIAFLSATQDTIIDAYRVERLTTEEQGTGSAWATFGYRIGMLVSGAGALYLADTIGWEMTYMLMAALVAASVGVTLLMKEVTRDVWRVANGSCVTRHASLVTFLRDYVIAPFRDFMTRPHWLPVLAFVILYKLGDAFMGTMFNPFLLDIGFTKSQIAEVVKLYGLIATLLGAFAGGWFVSHVGIFRALLLSGFLHMLTNLLLVLQAQMGANVHFLIFTVSLENFTGGMSSAAFIAYLSALCRVNYTATQYALLSSLASFGRTWLSTPSGWLSNILGWELFFAVASLMAIPGMLLLVWIERRKHSVV